MCFFFKQKTAYEMRISDWSSDVCSSDLKVPRGRPPAIERNSQLWVAQLWPNLCWDDSECPQVPPMTVDRPASSTAAMSQDSVGLLARHGELMDSQALIAFFKRSEEHTSELQSLMRISSAVLCLKKKN